MPNNGTSGNEKLRQQNLAKIRRAKASGDKKLVLLFDAMEAYYMGQLGADGYYDMLGKVQVDVLLKRFMSTPEGRKLAVRTGAGTASDGAKSASGGDVQDHVIIGGDDDEQDYDDQYSTDTEQSLLDERTSASPARRAEIDRQLDDIQRAREQSIRDNTYFDDFTAEGVVNGSGAGQGENIAADGSPADDGPIPYGRPSAFSPIGQGTDDPYPGGTPAADGEGEGEETAGGDEETRRSGEGGSDSPGSSADGTPVGGGDPDQFDPNRMREEATSSAEAPGDSTDVTQSGTSEAADRHSEPDTSTTETTTEESSNISASGTPTAGAEAPSLDTSSATAGGGGSAGEDGSGGRGVLAGDGEDDSRGSLDDNKGALEDAAKDAQDEENKEKDKKARKTMMRVLATVAPFLLPLILVIIAVCALASCISNFLPSSSASGNASLEVSDEMSRSSEGDASGGLGGGTGSTTTITRRSTQSNNGGIPRVDIDYQGLSEMFKEEEEGEEEEEEEEQDDGELTDAQKRVIEACKTTPSPGAGWCAAWVGSVYANANVGVTFSGDARDWWHAFCNPDEAPASCEAGTVKTDPNRSKLKPGMVIAVPSSSSGSDLGAIYGHVGIYIGNNQVMHNVGSIDTCTVDEWIAAYGNYADVGWGWADGIKLGGSGSDSGSADALDIHISSKKDIQKWAKKIDKYLAGHGAVEMGFKGEYFAEAAATYGIDPRLSAAQSCIEQARGDIINTGDYYNLWGWGVYGSYSGMIQTSNARDACFKHAKGLSEGYGSSFGPEQVAMYCPGNSEYWPWLKREADTISSL